MTLPPLYGHAEARRTLARAARAGTLAHSILLHGPAGIGKERLGLWLAQLLLCEAAGPEPCRQCQPCRLTERLHHPDLHWFFPLPRPEGTATPEKLREKLEEARAAELEARRENPLHVPGFDRPASYFLASIQTMQQLAGSRPAMGRRQVFVIGDAERMVPQESSPEAANAFLKLLEEPPPHTTLILTVERPGALLPTILSRVLPVRLRPLAEAEVAAYLRESGGVDAETARAVSAAARGSIGRALRLLPSGEGAGVLERQRQQARELLEAVLSSATAPRVAAAMQVAASGARGEFLPLLDAFAEWLRDLLAASAGATDRLLDRAEAAFLERSAQAARLAPPAIAAALQHVDAARALAEGNVNPQLIVADLLRRVRAELAPAK